MEDIYRLHLSVTGLFAYRTRIDYKNPGQNKWKRSGNLANVSLGISRDVYLKDVSGLQEGATIRFVMDIRCGKTLIAPQEFIYKKDSDCYASYNGAGVDHSNPKSVFKGLFPTIVHEIVFKGRISTAIDSGEASALFLKVSGAYAYDAKIQYREKSNTAWKTTDHIVNVTAGLPEKVFISEVKGINPGNQFRFVMDIVAGNKNVTANEYFTYKSDTTNIARYDCKGTTLDPEIRYNGIEAPTPADFVYDFDIEKEKLDKMVKEKAIEIAREKICESAKDLIAEKKGIERKKFIEEAIKEVLEEATEEAKKIVKEEEFRNFSIYSKNEAGLPIGACVRIENHNLADVMKFKNNGHITSISAKNRNKETRITTYASGPKGDGTGHIWFIDKGNECNEEEVILHGDIAKEQTTDFKDRDSNIIYISWNDKAMGKGTPLLESFTISGLLDKLLDFGGFFSDNDGYSYHTKVDCLQRPFGYCDLYDDVFNYATTMDREKFEFTSGGKLYIFWTWKGYYLNLGAGAEMGFYEYENTYTLDELMDVIMKKVDKIFDEKTKLNPLDMPFSKDIAKATITEIVSKVTDKKKNFVYDFYISDENTPMFFMKLTLDSKGHLPHPIYIYDTFKKNEKQWWITTFVPKLQGINPKDLTPKYDVYFNKNDPEHMQIFKDFKAACENHIKNGDSIYDWSSWSFEEGVGEQADFYIVTHTF